MFNGDYSDVEQGLGVSVVPELLIRGRGQRVVLRPLEPRASRSIALALPKGNDSPAVVAFAEGAGAWLKEHKIFRGQFPATHISKAGFMA